MASFVIEGGHRLSGEIHPQGAKNEVLQIICATLLTAEEVTVNNIPDILDVNNLIQLMREMGVTVAKEGVDTYSFKAENVDLAYLESDEFLKKCSSLRGSVMLIGPMVARFGKALISKPGGDKIVRLSIKGHLHLLAKGITGVHIHIVHGIIISVIKCTWAHFIDKTGGIVIAQAHIQASFFKVKREIGRAHV